MSIQNLYILNRTGIMYTRVSQKKTIYFLLSLYPFNTVKRREGFGFNYASYQRLKKKLIVSE